MSEETAQSSAEDPKAETPAKDKKAAESAEKEKPRQKPETKGQPSAKDKAGANEKAPNKADGAESEKESPGKDAQEKKSGEVTAEDLLKSEVGEVKIRRAKGSKNIPAGIVHVLATFNNTKVTITDKQGNVISWSSSGKCNFRGSRKSTAYAAQVVTQNAGRAAMAHGLKEVEIRVKGPGMGRDSAVRTLQALGLMVTSIVDVTPVPHNGCRPRKRRRV